MEWKPTERREENREGRKSRRGGGEICMMEEKNLTGRGERKEVSGS